MGYFRLFVEVESHAMTAQIAYHTIAVLLLGMLLNGVPNVANERVRLCCLHTNFETFLGNTHQFLFLWRCFSDDEHTACIGIIAINDARHVYVYDVALLQNVLFLGYSVAHHLIDAGADAFRKALVVEACGRGIVLLAERHTYIVNLLRVHSHVYSVGNSVQAACVYNTCTADSFNLFGCFYKVSSRHELAFLLEFHDFLIHFGGFLSRQTVPPSLFQYHCYRFKLFCKSTIINIDGKENRLIFAP